MTTFYDRKISMTTFYDRKIELQLGHKRAHHIDDNILMEGGAVLGCEVAHLDDGLRIVGVDVEDGRVHDAADVGAVRRGPAVAGIRGEADLGAVPRSLDHFRRNI
jgi:hypothetical protein